MNFNNESYAQQELQKLHWSQLNRNWRIREAEKCRRSLSHAEGQLQPLFSWEKIKQQWHTLTQLRRIQIDISLHVRKSVANH